MPTASPWAFWHGPLGAEQIYRRLAPAVLALELPDGGGAGVLLTRSGLIVTCHHLVESWSTARVRLASGREGTASLLRSYRDADLAFLQLEPVLLAAVLPGLRSPLIGRRIPPGRWPVVGETVLVIGHPMGLEHSLSRGVVSASDRRIDGRRYLQLDASINPGNSGGPVCSERAEWLGIVTSSRIDCEGVSFAIPIPIVYAKLRDYRQERRDHPGPRLYCSVCGHASPPGRSCEHCGALLALVEVDDALSGTEPGTRAEP